jgi:hypothetical protein
MDPKFLVENKQRLFKIVAEIADLEKEYAIRKKIDDDNTIQW